MDQYTISLRPWSVAMIDTSGWRVVRVNYKKKLTKIFKTTGKISSIPTLFTTNFNQSYSAGMMLWIKRKNICRTVLLRIIESQKNSTLVPVL